MPFGGGVSGQLSGTAMPHIAQHAACFTLPVAVAAFTPIPIPAPHEKGVLSAERYQSPICFASPVGSVHTRSLEPWYEPVRLFGFLPLVFAVFAAARRYIRR